MDEKPSIYPLYQIAAKMNCSKQHVYHLVRTKQLKALREGGRLVVKAADIDEFIRNLPGAIEENT
jgi:excisionase family DNA binding protein